MSWDLSPATGSKPPRQRPPSDFALVFAIAVFVATLLFGDGLIEWLGQQVLLVNEIDDLLHGGLISARRALGDDILD